MLLTRLARTWKVLLIGALASTTAIAGLDRLGWLTRLDDIAYDEALVAFSPPARRSEHVTVIALDDRTFQEVQADPGLSHDYGAWPYARGVWATVLQYLGDHGAKAVVFDMVMDERHPDEGGESRLHDVAAALPVPFALGFALNASPRFPLLPATPAPNRWPPLAPLTGEPGPQTAAADPDDPFGAVAASAPALSPEQLAQVLTFPVRAERLTLPTLTTPTGEVLRPVTPLPQLLPVVSAFGLVLPEEDADGKLRRTRFAYSDGRNSYAMLAIAAAADVLKAERVELAPYRLTLGPRSLKLGPDGSARIDFQGTLQDRFATVSLIEVIRSARGLTSAPLDADALFRDKVVVVGGFALGTWDQKATPFESRVPGVMKQASELDSLLHGQFIVDLPKVCTWGVMLIAALLSFAVIVLAGRLAVEVGWAVLSPLALIALSGVLLTRNHQYLPIALPVLTALLSSGAAIAINRLYADRERDRVRTMFTRYLSKDVVKQLVEQPEMPSLFGEDLQVTAFFSDIRGFSTFSERYKDDPRALVRVLNTYLTRVSTVLLEHGACLDKYIGDAIVCLYGAPVKHADHAVRACLGALAAQAEVAKLREEFRAQGLPDVYTRIGLNTAVMFVGNLGSEQLFNYTAIGDGMNLAARLEGANKNYESSIMIGPLTYAQAKDAIEARELDWVRVAGKTEPVAVYELLAPRGKLPEAKRQVVERYHQALAVYRRGEFPAALAAFEAALALDPNDGPSKALIARCKKLIDHPPPLPFDGVANLEK